MMTSLRLHEIAESRHRILNALSLDKLVLAAELAGVASGARVLDLCCGKGELLAQWAQRTGCSGHGVDASEVFLHAARERADELGVGAQLTFEHQDAEFFATDEPFDVVCCVGASWFAGDLARSVARMREWVTPGGTLVLGEPFWRSSPPPGAEDHWDERFHSLPGLFDWVDSIGLEIVEMVLSSPDDWDRYCAAQWRNLYDWLAAYPEDPDAPAVRDRLTTSRRRFVTVQREHLGWGLFVLRPRL